MDRLIHISSHLCRSFPLFLGLVGLAWPANNIFHGFRFKLVHYTRALPLLAGIHVSAALGSPAPHTTWANIVPTNAKRLAHE